MDEEMICPECGKELHRKYIKLDDLGGYDFILGEEFSCKCGYKRIEG